MPLLLALVLFAGYSYPSYFKADQKISADIILDQVVSYLLIHIFIWPLPGLSLGLRQAGLSHTGDYGCSKLIIIFGARNGGYKDRKKFLKDMSNPKHAVVAATIVLNEMKKYKACEGLHLAACYNGGPNWRNSKNKDKILKYANRVNCLAQAYRNKFPNWIK